MTPIQRSSNFELLRILSIVLILLMHTYSQAQNNDMTSGNYYLGVLINSIGNIGVSCFILISGYFGINFKKFKFIQLIILTTFYSIVLYLINYGFTISNKLFNALLVIPLYKNWFIACYLILMLLSPYLNAYISASTKKNLEKLLMILFIVFSVLPTIFNTPYYTILTGGGKCLVYMIFLYLIGRYIRIYRNKNVKKKKAAGLFLLMTAIICSLNIGMGFLLKKPCSIYALDCSPFILTSAISVFYLFKSFVFQSKLINYLASSTIAVYLLDGLRLFVDSHIIHLHIYSNSNQLLFLLTTEVVLVFTMSIFIDKLRIFLLGKWEENTINWILQHYTKAEKI